MTERDHELSNTQTVRCRCPWERSQRDRRSADWVGGGAAATSGDGEPVGSIAKAKETAGPKALTMSKAATLIRKLKSSKGTTIETMMRMTGWQAHSVRGFLSAIVRKKLGHPIASEVGKDGVRRYRIIAARKER